MLPSVVAICGKGRIATFALDCTAEALAKRGGGVPIVVVPNANDSGQDTWHPSLTRAAALRGYRCVSLASLEAEAGLLLLSLEYDRVIRVVRFASRRLFNIHFSNLPAYRGVLTSIWPLLNGEREAGVTLHQVDAGIDTGPIVAQRLFPIPESCTARQLYEMYMDEACRLFADHVGVLLEEMPPLSPQDESRATYYSRKSIDLSRPEVNWSADADAVIRFVRALHFPEYQLPTVNGRPVSAGRVLADRSDAPAGTPVRETPEGGTFVAGDGRLVELTWA